MSLRHPNRWARAQQNPANWGGVDWAPTAPGSEEKLRLGDFAALDAAGAHADALGGAVHQGLHGLQVRVPAAARHVVGVRNVVTELRTLAANIANLCHDFAPNRV